MENHSSFSDTILLASYSRPTDDCIEDARF